MPASALALNLTADFRARQLARRQSTVGSTTSSWRSLVDPENLDETFAMWLGLAVGTVAAAKVLGVTEAGVYLSDFVAAETARDPVRPVVDPDPYMDTIDGRPMDQALATPLLTVKGALAGGSSPLNALQLGLVRATRIVAEEVLSTPRRAVADLMADSPRVRGGRRVVSSNACGACLALTVGHVEAPESFHRTHMQCRCVWEPVVRGVRERFRRPTGREIFDALTVEQQAHLFAGRGGAEKAELVRSGEVPFDSLVKREPMAVTPDQYTEASLEDLRAMATGPGRDVPATTTEDGRDG